MALKGNLSDFSLADIFQLVGQQGKTGVLSLVKDSKKSSRIFFLEGKIVHTEQAKNDEQKLFGTRMILADLITQQELDDALAEQKRTQLRLGPILVQKGYVDRSTLREMVRLQTMESLYEIFQWESADYEFIQHDDFDHDPHTQSPIPAEEILLEIFRIVDEWPSLRIVIPHFQYTCTRIQNLPRENEMLDTSPDDDFLAGMAEAMGGPSSESSDKDKASKIGEHERRAFNLVKPGRSIHRIIELSRLGEFDTCKALCTLQKGEFISISEPTVSDGDAKSGRFPLLRSMIRATPAIATRVFMWAVFAVFISGFVDFLEKSQVTTTNKSIAHIPSTRSMKQYVVKEQLVLLAETIEVFRMLEGNYPSSLEEMEQGGYISSEEQTGFSDAAFSYVRTETSYRLLPPYR
jgi:hypothetical protein